MYVVSGSGLVCVCGEWFWAGVCVVVSGSGLVCVCGEWFWAGVCMW